MGESVEQWVHECICGLISSPVSAWGDLLKQKQPHISYWHLVHLPPHHHCHPFFPRDASLSLTYHQKRASVLSAYFQISWVPLRVTYQILNHVLGCRPSPPILLIHPMPHCHCLQLRLRLKGAYPKRQSPGFVGVRLSPHEEWSFPRDPNYCNTIYWSIVLTIFRVKPSSTRVCVCVSAAKERCI